MIVFPELKNFTIDINSKVKDAIKLINKNQRGIALVTDKNNVLKGVLNHISTLCLQLALPIL